MKSACFQRKLRTNQPGFIVLLMLLIIVVVCGLLWLDPFALSGSKDKSLPWNQLKRIVPDDEVVPSLTEQQPRVKTKRLMQAPGYCDAADITEQVSETIAKSGLSNGTVTVFNIGLTAGITTTEYEPGFVNYDIVAAFEKIAPANAGYEHKGKAWLFDPFQNHKPIF